MRHHSPVRHHEPIIRHHSPVRHYSPVRHCSPVKTCLSCYVAPCCCSPAKFSCYTCRISPCCCSPRKLACCLLCNISPCCCSPSIRSCGACRVNPCCCAASCKPLLNCHDEDNLVSGLRDFISLERELESAKTSLTLKPDFNLHDAFVIFDHHRHSDFN